MAVVVTVMVTVLSVILSMVQEARLGRAWSFQEVLLGSSLVLDYTLGVTLGHLAQEEKRVNSSPSVFLEEETSKVYNVEAEAKKRGLNLRSLILSEAVLELGTDNPGM